MSISVKDHVAASRERSILLRELREETHPDIRYALKRQIESASDILGISPPNMDDIGHERIPGEPNPHLTAFWSAVHSIGLHAVNHSIHKGQIAINLTHFLDLADEADIDLPDRKQLKRALFESVEPRYVSNNQNIRSAITGTTLRCWVFAYD